MLNEGRRIERTITHLPGIAKPEAEWDDALTFSEMVVDPNLDTVLQIEDQAIGRQVPRLLQRPRVRAWHVEHAAPRPDVHSVSRIPAWGPRT